jgi:hypothetical protein
MTLFCVLYQHVVCQAECNRLPSWQRIRMRRLPCRRSRGTPRPTFRALISPSMGPFAGLPG